MIGVVWGLKLLIPINLHNKISCVLYVFIIAIIGAITYLYTAYKMQILQDVFGKEFLNKIIKKLTLGRVSLKN